MRDTKEGTTGNDTPPMDARPAALLTRLLLVCEDLRYAVREERLAEFCDDCIIENEPGTAEKAGIPPVAFVLPAPEMAVLHQTGASPPLPKPAVPPPATAWEIADLLQRILTDCKGVRGIESPAAPRPSLLQEAQALLSRVARDDLTR
jgi:hypothetical protein